ncbi:single-stranded-DNA-specific exonuclease RecJ [Alkalihalobacterium alkalinitrilicum]|uniref:single-stranded-DNA-specific exonuclease RecJ n=1 Tax=Alkalihalobacterium alkalinitrilicum TaxID=427920 RepID=UPI0009957548|nr:single-stranded-DNA-specific exonuclease RecJ [Alkalihalobacterium alkalinitrilicum]
MLKSNKRWKLAQLEQDKVNLLMEELNLSPIVAKLLVLRGIDTVQAATRFLYKEEVSFYDPFLLDGMKEAVDRIKEAIVKNEKILIYGDYDADGVSSTSVMIYLMKELGANFNYYIPNRFTEGYGPNEAAFRQAKVDGYDLIVTVDTGISAVHEAEVAKEIGIDLIITDHHEAPPHLPDAYAIVNPKKPGCTYPFKGLAGVGVAFKLAHALLEEVPSHLLDIVAIGTIADLVPLVDENRLLAKKGIEALQRTTKPGLRAIKKIAGIDGQTVNAEHVGFAIGPRINAAGRLDSADPAVELLTTDDEMVGKEIAEEIDQLNKERKAIVDEMAKEAIAQVETQFPPSDNRVLIVGKEGWNPGVIGIVASRLVEKFYRPTIVLSLDREKGVAKGSARSIEGFDMFVNLSESRDILPHFGGHPMAAGLTMQIEHVEELRNRLNSQADRLLTEEDFIPITNVDLVATLDEISLDVINQLEELAPYGVSNPVPKVMIEEVNIAQIRRIGTDENHLKVLFEHEGTTLDGIGFQLGYLHPEINQAAKISAVGTISVNEWNGHCKPQIFLEDIQVNEWQLFDWRNAKKLLDNIQSLPLQKRTLIAFQRSTVDKLGLETIKDEICVHSFDLVDLEGKYIILLDLPNSVKQLQELLSMKEGTPERIYSVFYQEDSNFFTTLPKREHFKWYYAFLTKKGAFDIKKYGQQLATHKGWSKNTVDFMTKVFFELDFVTINNGIISLHPTPSKKGLDESETYQRMTEQSKLEQQFLYSSYYELKLWFDQVIEQARKVKESV